jgi:hypothetical protein
MSKSGFTR